MDVDLRGSGFYSGSYTSDRVLTETCSMCATETESDEVYHDDYNDYYILCSSCGDAIELTYDDE